MPVIKAELRTEIVKQWIENLTPEEKKAMCGPFPEEDEYLDGMAERIAEQLFKNV